LTVRAAAFEKIDIIAKALGEQRTRDELIPFLTEFVDDEDEVLTILASKLGDLLELIGGPEHMHLLLVSLEALVVVEEITVRNKALEVVNNVASLMSVGTVREYMMPLLKRLATSFWFTSRISSCALFCAIHEQFNKENKQDNSRDALKEMYIRLCEDETPMVRRAACTNVAKLVQVLPFNDVKTTIFAALEKLAADDQDSVRLLVVDTVIQLNKTFQENKESPTLMLPLVLRLCVDKSWRVRHVVATQFCELVESMEGIDSKHLGDLVNAYSQLLRDAEAEVRTAAALKVAKVAVLVGPELTSEKLVPPVKTLVKDSSQFTRAALGSVIMGLAKVVPKQDVLANLLESYLQLLKDQHPDVRLNIISNLDCLKDVIGLESISQSFLPAIIELAMDKQWRIRLAIIEHIPSLAKQFGAEFFESKLLDLSMNWLGDQVFSIRSAATRNLTKLSEVFGTEWSNANIVPKVLNLGTHKSYLFRMTSLFAARDLAFVFPQQESQKLFIPLMVQLAGDTVPNVRFNVAKALGKMATVCDVKSVQDQILPTLRTLATKDKDPDVKYYAQKSIEAINNDTKAPIESKTQ
jgi:serine/threonine-protein phosphatase 2A regulatory subunit A